MADGGDGAVVTRRRSDRIRTKMSGSMGRGGEKEQQDDLEGRRSDDAPLLPENNKSLTKDETTTSSTAAAGAAKAFSLLSLAFVFMQIFCEVSKQVSNYSVQYFNGGRYPIPQTVIVILMEFIKLVATICRAKGSIPSFSTESLRASLKFLVPSVLYALNNNIYFLGLTLVPPPIWLILCSCRTAITACIYKFWLKRPLSMWQFAGAFLIVTSIVTAKLPDIVGKGTSGGINAVPLAAISLAIVASSNSVGAAVYTESLFKSGGAKGESFLDQQFWLYLYGMGVASVVHLASNPTYGPADLAESFVQMPTMVLALLCFAMFIGSCGGLVVAAILKFLDNIVKEYTGNIANIITAVFCSFLFPDKFQFTVYIVLSLAFLLSGIYLYETGKAKPATASSSSASSAENEKT